MKYPLNGSHYTEADDLEMLSHPEDWGVMLFVKRGRPADQLGTVEAAPAFDSSGNTWPHGRLVYVRGGGTIHYDDPAAMVADGWRVD